MRITVEITGVPELVRALGQAKERALRALEVALYQEAVLIMGQSKLLVPVDEGTLRNSGFVELPKRDAAGVEVVMGYGGAASGYAVYVHEGTGPAVGRPAFFPPIAPIRDWVRRNLRVPHDKLDSVAFVVARAIGRRGLRPRKFLETPFKARESTMGARLGAKVKRAMESKGG